jgi:hypothetical protein
MPAGRAVVVVRHIVLRLAEASVEDIKARYDLGEVVCTLRRVMPRAAAALELNAVAKSMGIHASALRRYARVTEAIGGPEFAQLLRLRTARGMSLTWSHVEHLAMVHDPARRKALAAAAADEALSVRALAQRLRR